jgi:transcription antitermination factor NusG
MLENSIAEYTQDGGRNLNLFESSSDSLKWYAAYTNSNYEKCVAAQLERRSVEHFLPQYESVRRRKDRRVKLQLPLFPGYVFVRFNLRDRLRVLQVPGVARLVGFNGLPCPVPNSDIEALQFCLARNVSLQPHSYVQVGRRVRIGTGPLEGMEGIVIRRKNRLRFIISLSLIHGSAAVTVDASELHVLNIERNYSLNQWRQSIQPEVGSTPNL